MVKICSKIYPQENEEIYKEHFDMFDFPLSDFQKHAIEAIVSGNHTLICVPTGNGKTLPSEFAINYFVSRGKKVIYTSPIKALSNQVRYLFQFYLMRILGYLFLSQQDLTAFLPFFLF